MDPCDFAPVLLLASIALGPAAFGQTTPVDPASKCSVYASIPLPAEAERVAIPKSYPACASANSYSGIGRPVNYSAARACAWKERLAEKAGLEQNYRPWVVGGSVILADIYLNGAGVKPNIPLAIRFACEAEEGMATLALSDVAKRNALPHPGKAFEFCDYAESNITMNFCYGYEMAIADDRRSRFYNSLTSAMTPEQRAAFEKLLTAESAYVTAHFSEVDQGGSIRGVRTMGSQDILKDLFHTEIVHFERKEWPKLTNNQIATADALLGREYEKQLRQSRSHTKDEIDEGAVTAADLSKVETKWQGYRDAWVTFAQLRYPSAVAAIRAEITLRRYEFVKTIS